MVAGGAVERLLGQRAQLGHVGGGRARLVLELDAPVLDTHRLLLGHLGPEKLLALLQLLGEAHPPSA